MQKYLFLSLLYVYPKSTATPLIFRLVILAFVMFVCGLFIALNPGVITTTIGIIMIVYSIIDIAETIILMKNLKDVF